MKLLFGVLLCAALTCAAFGTTQEALSSKPKKEFKHKFQITSKYDKGKDQTIVTLKPMPITTSMAKEVTDLKQIPQMDLEVYFTYPGDHIAKPVGDATIALHSISQNIVYRQPQDLIAVLNAQSYLPLGTTKYKSISKTFMFEEILSLSVPLDAMQKMSNAKDMELVLGRQRELKLTEPQMEALRDITSRMSP
jgi:hypothetical protein